MSVNTGTITYTSTTYMGGPVAGLSGSSQWTSSYQIPLDPTARTTTVMLCGTSNITSTSTISAPGLLVAIQATLDPWVPGGVTQSWASISSQFYNLGVGVVASAGGGSTLASSEGPTVLTDGVFASILGPIAGLRIGIISTSGMGNTSQYTFGTAGLTLKALQSVTAGP